MRGYLVAIVVGGIALPLLMHFISPAAMPWWPDTVSVALAGAATAPIILWRTRADRAFRHRVGTVIIKAVHRSAYPAIIRRLSN